MKKIILTVVSFLFMNVVFSQIKNDSIIINSLDFLNKEFYMNFEKAGAYILVIYEGNYYVVDKYYDKTKSIDGIKIKIIYELKNTESNEYGFSIKVAGSEYRGSFDYKNGKMSKLSYMIIDTDYGLPDRNLKNKNNSKKR